MPPATPACAEAAEAVSADPDFDAVGDGGLGRECGPGSITAPRLTAAAEPDHGCQMPTMIAKSITVAAVMVRARRCLLVGPGRCAGPCGAPGARPARVVAHLVATAAGRSEPRPGRRSTRAFRGGCSTREGIAVAARTPRAGGRPSREDGAPARSARPLRCPIRTATELRLWLERCPPGDGWSARMDVRPGPTTCAASGCGRAS